jgi:SpoVK/Ycf46/Vps4 family AAA+-type ATPase
LSEKATKIKTTFLWEQLILPREQKQQLRQICNRVLYEHIVYDEWGYDALLPYGRGICMLFVGKSGTGKTMAAQVIGKELGLQVYRVDISQIVSKYIRETEKNINAIFDEAMKSNIILFFDEMEALFAKRTDVKNANDRYTNMEVAFLL